jgi:hypothetical protein
MSILEIEKISITILMDNSTDLLLKNSAHALRTQLIGFSALVSITTKDNRQDQYLYDTGVTENGVIHNADLLCRSNARQNHSKRCWYNIFFLEKLRGHIRPIQSLSVD